MRRNQVLTHLDVLDYIRTHEYKQPASTTLQKLTNLVSITNHFLNTDKLHCAYRQIGVKSFVKHLKFVRYQLKPDILSLTVFITVCLTAESVFKDLPSTETLLSHYYNDYLEEYGGYDAYVDSLEYEYGQF